MSGRKYSEVALRNNVREAIHCRLVAEDSLRCAESLTAALEAAAGETESLQASANHARQTLEEARTTLEEVRSSFAEEKMMQLSLNEVHAKRRKVEGLKAALDQIAARCREGQDAAGLRAELARLMAEMDSGREAYEPWLRDVWEDYSSKTRALLKEMDEQISTTGSAGDVTPHVLPHAAEFQQMRAQASERRSQDAERRYIAGALRQVCVNELGFSAHTLPQNSPLDDLVVEVDTFAYGIIHFRLQLDGTIRSQSNITPASCPANFKRIEEGLHALGVISSFRYEGDQQPVRLERDSRDLPDSGIAAQHAGLPK